MNDHNSLVNMSVKKACRIRITDLYNLSTFCDFISETNQKEVQVKITKWTRMPVKIFKKYFPFMNILRSFFLLGSSCNYSHLILNPERIYALDWTLWNLLFNRVLHQRVQNQCIWRYTVEAFFYVRDIFFLLIKVYNKMTKQS